MSEAKQSFIYRKDPVPHVGNGNHYKRYERKPKIFYALKECFNCVEENIRVRGKRSMSSFPNWYFIDLPVSKEQLRGWKRTKKLKQWMKGVCVFDVTPPDIIYIDELFPEESSPYTEGSD